MCNGEEARSAFGEWPLYEALTEMPTKLSLLEMETLATPLLAWGLFFIQTYTFLYLKKLCITNTYLWGWQGVCHWSRWSLWYDGPCYLWWSPAGEMVLWCKIFPFLIEEICDVSCARAEHIIPLPTPPLKSKGKKVLISPGLNLMDESSYRVLSHNAWPLLKSGVGAAFTIHDLKVHKACVSLELLDIYAGTCGAVPGSFSWTVKLGYKDSRFW